MGKRSQPLITKTVVDNLGQNQTIWDREVRGFHIRRQVHDRVYGLTCKGQRHDVVDVVETYRDVEKEDEVNAHLRDRENGSATHQEAARLQRCIISFDVALTHRDRSAPLRWIAPAA